MEALKFLSIFLVFATTCFVSSSYGYKFYVGGRDGWVLNPSENYNHWAGRMRFQVNDTLYFKYKKGMNSVLVVDKDDYYSCNVDKPILKLEDGDSTFVFDRSGPFFFISGNDTNCDKGQKLIIVVLAIRHSHFPPPTSDSPASPPTAGKAPAPASSPGKSPVSAPSPVPSAPIAPPVSAPSPAPVVAAPTPVVSAPPTPSSISPSGSVPPGATSPPGSSPSSSSGKAPPKSSAQPAAGVASSPAMILLSLITLCFWV